MNTRRILLWDEPAAEPKPAQVDPLAAWPAFSRSVRKRLEAGAREYGDKSFTRAPAALLTEIQQELLDVAGWAYILHQRLEALRVQINDGGGSDE